jgi:uncharacterized protein YkwD
LSTMRHPRGRIARAGTVVAVVAAMIAGPGTARAGTPNYSWQLFRATNEARIRHGLHPLDRAHRMSDYAQRHSRQMANQGRLWHTSGPSRYGAHCYSWGENVGMTSGDVADVQRAFMSSAVHRSHILFRGFDRTGVGAVRSGGNLWVTVFFCR